VVGTFENKHGKRRFMKAAQRSGAAWEIPHPLETGPRGGIRGAFTDGPRHRARARRRGKTADRRRARHAATMSLRTGVATPAVFGLGVSAGGRMPRHLQASFLDREDLDPT